MKKKLLIWLVILLFLGAGAFGGYPFLQKQTIAAMIPEYQNHCMEALADVYELPDCVEYGLTDFTFEITDCTFCRDITGARYIATVQVDCQTPMDLNRTQKQLLAYEVLQQIPDKFTTSKGKRVTVWDSSSDEVYKGKLIYVAVNGEIILQPEAVTGSSDVIYCPTCGTGWNANHPAGKYVKQNGRCSYCPD